MTASVIYSLVTAFLFGLGYFVFRYYKKDALKEAKSIGLNISYGSLITDRQYETLMQIVDSPEIFEDMKSIANEDWQYYSYLKSWSENNTKILDRFKNNQRRMTYYYFFDALQKLFWPVVLLIFVAPLSIPFFVLGYFSIIFFYFIKAIYVYYYGDGMVYLAYLLASNINGYSKGTRYWVEKHPYLTLSFWVEWTKGWWKLLQLLNTKPDSSTGS